MSRAIRFVIALLLAVVAPLAMATPASAHASQRGSTPTANAVLDRAPAQVDIEFDSALMDVGAAVVVRDDDGKSIVTGAPEVRRNHLRVAVDAGASPARYTVAYRVVSEDGHTIESSFTYQVSGSSASPAPPEDVPSDSAPTAAPLDDGTGPADGTPPYALIGAGLLALMVGVVGAIALRR